MKALRLAPTRFMVDAEVFHLTTRQQDVLGGSQVYSAGDGGLLVSGWARNDTVDSLRKKGVIEPFSWGLTEHGTALVHLLRREKQKRGEVGELRA